MLISLDRYRRKRWQFCYSNRPAAKVIVFPHTPSLMPPLHQDIGNNFLDDHEMASLLLHQSQMVSPLGQKLLLAYESLVALVGEEQAGIQVFAIVDEYLKDRAA